MKKVLLTEKEFAALEKIRHGVRHVSHLNAHLNENVSGDINLTADEKKELDQLKKDGYDYTDATFLTSPEDFIDKFDLKGVVDSEFDESSKIYLKSMPSKVTLFKIYKAIFKYNLACYYYYNDNVDNKKVIDPGSNLNSDNDHLIFTVFTRDDDEVIAYKFFNAKSPTDIIEIKNVAPAVIADIPEEANCVLNIDLVEAM
jgi:hypothetical protein